MRVCLIFNPVAGTADRIKDVLLQLTGRTRCELRATSPELPASQIAREAVDEGFDRIVVAGGDGSISEVVNGIAPDFSAIELAVLPFGTGNDLARCLGLLPENLSTACRDVFEGQAVYIDLIQITADDAVSYCVNVANGGLGGLVARDILREDKQRWGPLAYWMTTVSEVINLPVYEVQVDIDGQLLEMEATGVAISNGRFVGGGFPIAPRALLDDGLLDVTVCPALPMAELLAAGLNFTLGKEQTDRRIQEYRAQRVRIQSSPDIPFSIDGEPGSRMDATFEVVPRALRIVPGPSPIALSQHHD